jgi:hypothetical protein
MWSLSYDRGRVDNPPEDSSPQTFGLRYTIGDSLWLNGKLLKKDFKNVLLVGKENYYPLVED